MKTDIEMYRFFCYICIMSTTINDYIKKCQFVASEMLNEQEKIVYLNKDKIVNLNKNAFTDGYGNNGKNLINILPQFNGEYGPGYKKTGLYDFYETGNFIKGLNITVEQKDKINIFSTGTGQGEKSLFFAGYTNLFGLDKTNTDIVNYNIILPELMKFIKRYL